MRFVIKSIQVPEFELAQFLEEKKTEGWTLLGVEQTANSASLVDFIFPKKCVLLLGILVLIFHNIYRKGERGNSR